MATLSLDNLTKVYRPRGREPVLAVDHVNLEVGDGEIVGLLGSSGCGKTSTLRMIAGFEEASEGKIRRNGREIQDLPPSQRDVAMAFEGYALYPPLRLRDNIGFALLRGRRPPQRDRPAGRRAGGAAGDRGYPRPLSQLDLRRAAAAHQPGPRPDPPGPALAAGRAHVPARAAAARHTARPDQGLSDPESHDDDLRHPRPDRGDRARRPDRGDGERRAAAICGTRRI